MFFITTHVVVTQSKFESKFETTGAAKTKSKTAAIGVVKKEGGSAPSRPNLAF